MRITSRCRTCQSSYHHLQVPLPQLSIKSSVISPPDAASINLQVPLPQISIKSSVISPPDAAPINQVIVRLTSNVQLSHLSIKSSFVSSPGVALVNQVIIIFRCRIYQSSHLSYHLQVPHLSVKYSRTTQITTWPHSGASGSISLFQYLMKRRSRIGDPRSGYKNEQQIIRSSG
jgi:hypothetical protein